MVEDEEVVCRLIADSLTSAGYDVTATGDPRAALELAREQRFDVLVTDMTMPHMNGAEVARALLERCLTCASSTRPVTARQPQQTARR